MASEILHETSSSANDDHIPSSDRCEAGAFNIPIAQWPATAQDESPDVLSVSENLVDQLNSALTGNDFDTLSQLFLENSYLRDHLGLTWEFEL